MNQLKNSPQNLNEYRLGLLLTPSWLIALVAIVAGLILVVGVWLIFGLHNVADQQQITKWQNNNIQNALTLPGRPVAESNASSLQNTWPLLAFWGVVGLIVYIFVQAIMRFFGQISELQHELGYVNISRDKLRKDIMAELGFRLLAAVFWLFYCNLFFKVIIPYALTAAHASASDIVSLAGLLAALLAFAVIALSIQVHTILLRLILGRPRIWS